MTPIHPKDEEFKQLFKRFRDPKKRLIGRPFALWQFVQGIAHLEGNTAECGVGSGRSSHLICAATENETRMHHIFDSFEGLSEIRPEDHTPHRQWKKGECARPLEAVDRALNDHKRITYWPGWIPDRFGGVSDCEFIFVHVDVDLYQPTRDSVRFFYPRLVPGGMLLCDDYASPRCPGARKAMDDYGEEIGVHVIHCTSGQGLLIKREDKP
jgi:hypothetical protein